jgi:hypothetical protein
MLFRNLTISLGMETGCQGGQGSARAVVPSEEVVLERGLLSFVRIIEELLE